MYFGGFFLILLTGHVKMLAYVVGRPCAYFTTQNLLSRKNGNFKMALNMRTYAAK